MKREAEIKELLISNAIHLIAEGGFEKATTKNLTYYSTEPSGIRMNEVYIYRIFGSKEALYQEVFSTLERELYYTLKDSVKELEGFKGKTKETLQIVFMKVWQFVLKNEERCRCYVRYYYSIYFKGESLETHQKHFTSIVKSFNPLFKEEADVISIMHSVFTALLDFAIRVYNGELEDNEINRPHIFNVLYCMMMTYFKDSEKVS